MYKGISVSPSHGGFAPGYEAPPSDLENLVAGREREVGNLMYQAIAERVLRGEVDISGTPSDENLLRDGGSLAQNTLGSGFISLSGIQRRL